MKPWLIRNYDPDLHRLSRRLKYTEFGPGRLRLDENMLRSASSLRRSHSASSPCQSDEEEQEEVPHRVRARHKTNAVRFADEGQNQKQDPGDFIARTSSHSYLVNLEVPQESGHPRIESRNERQQPREPKKQNNPFKFD